MYQQEDQQAAIMGHKPCSDCGSSDALAIYADHTFCFSCSAHHSTTCGEVSSPPISTNKAFTPLVGDILPLKARQLTQGTCKKFGYHVCEYNSVTVQVANYIKCGRIVGQKIRNAAKRFSWRGNNNSGLFGQHLWKEGGRKIVVTEGEIDAMTVSQIQDHKWPVVSLPHGAAAAVKSIKESIEYLETFEEVILMFDMDDAGQKAAYSCCNLLSPGKAKIATIDLKDPNEMLIAGRSSEVITAIWQAKSYLPSGIINAKDLWNKIEKPIEYGLSYPWESLTKAVYGIRQGEIITLGAGTGLGKTTCFKQIIYHLITEHKAKVGIFFLEETNSMTALSLMSINLKLPLHIPNIKIDPIKKEKAFETLFYDDKCFLFDHYGSTDYNEIKLRIRYLAITCKVKYIFLDHITALTSGGHQSDERKTIDAIMTDLSSLVRELNVTLFMISHLTTPEKSAHEEGARVTIRQFRGSRSIGQWSNFVFALERNQQADEETKRHTSTFRILKDRYTGESTGKTFKLYFDVNSQILNEVKDEIKIDENGESDIKDIPF